MHTTLTLMAHRQSPIGLTIYVGVVEDEMWQRRVMFANLQIKEKLKSETTGGFEN